MLSTYVDNLFSWGDCPLHAVAIPEDFASELNTVWGQRIKPSSRSIMVPRGNTQELPDENRWPCQSEMPCLGFIIQDNAETDLAELHGSEKLQNQAQTPTQTLAQSGTGQQIPK